MHTFDNRESIRDNDLLDRLFAEGPAIEAVLEELQGQRNKAREAVREAELAVTAKNESRQDTIDAVCNIADLFKDKLEPLVRNGDIAGFRDVWFQMIEDFDNV